MVLSDYIIDIAAGPFGSNLKVECFVEYGFPIIDGANLRGVKVSDNITKFVTEEKARSLSRSIAKRNDVVVTISGNVGQISYIPNNSLFEEYLVSQRQFRVTFDLEKINVPYLVYYFHSREGNNKILSFANQTGVPALSQPLKNFRNIEIDLPPLSTQSRIASILSSLDSKIETNNKINAKLEEMAQALFKSWFVDFEPFKDGEFEESELGRIPKGWRVGKLTEIATYTNGLAMQKFPPNDINDSYPVLKIKELGQGFCDSSSDRCSKNIREDVIVFDGDVIFSWSGTLLVDLWCGGECGLNQHLFKVTSSEYPKWFYLYWTKHHLEEFIRIAKDKAVTMGHIKRGHLESALVAIPSKSDMKKINDIITPIVDKLVSTRVENRNLSHLRDTLLPKLMNGEIEIN